MRLLYDDDPPVSPLVIAPVGKLNTEASFIIAPAHLARRQRLQAFLGRAGTARIMNAVIGQIFLLTRGIVAIATIQTGVADRRSGRLGQELTVGFYIQPAVFRLHGEVLERAFLILDDFTRDRFGRRLSCGGADEIVRTLQGDAVDYAQRFGDLIPLFRRLESEFGLAYREGPSVLACIRHHARTRRFLRRPRLQAEAAFDDLRSFLIYADQRLCAVEPPHLLLRRQSPERPTAGSGPPGAAKGQPADRECPGVEPVHRCRSGSWWV